MGGDIVAHGGETGGSVFVVSLPLERHVSARCGHDHAPAWQTDPTAEAGAGSANLKILVAEDNPTNQLVITTLLGELGASITVVANGAQAVAAWRSEDWDVVLMDIQMPVMDGVSATREIRAAETALGRRTPILALTANVMQHQQQQYLAAGMDGVVAKPLQIVELLGAISRALLPPAPADVTSAHFPGSS